MTCYTLTDNLALQVNVFNVANRNYIDEIHPAHIVPGAGTSGLSGFTSGFSHQLPGSITVLITIPNV